MENRNLPPGFAEAVSFPLVQALFGRRARRFFRGASIPDGYFQYTSRHEPMPLSPLEQMLVLTAAAGNTGWHYLIMRSARYAPALSNYACTAGGRTNPSAAGFHTSELFYTDDDGVYFLETRDAPALVRRPEDGCPDLEELLEAHRSRIHRIVDGRLNLPPEVPYVEGHNTWVANRPGSTLIIPVGDLAQHVLAVLCYYLQNGQCVYDDVHNERIAGMERYRHLCDVDSPLPLTFLEQVSLAELTAELSTACYAGMLMLQAMGLGGWMFDGIDPVSVLGASGNPDVAGLGFRYDTDARWPLPNPTGLPGVFEGFTPPHYPDMRSALDALVKRKFGAGGPFHPATPGPYRETTAVRGRAQEYSEEFCECVALQAQHIYDRFGKFPGTVPSIFVLTYLQAQHIDLEFYDRFYQPGAYLQTHARHMENWHPEGGG
ncbi:hypothetical protein FGU65_14455 [Methanoculleus sp. FWC-SCC1]|uniref:Uncharacterized protein n=1 Tax=Methanoculleus frigidifontis TaxID=2584085 RepID=A0ABT8MDP7_9EURY|nr:hypothetical protein [Methanoculleus sp. FWC-SCC1]MDN7026067.1 hypothetical protein [Methanoculleus sp. FWC-SCC1]